MLCSVAQVGLWGKFLLSGKRRWPAPVTKLPSVMEGAQKSRPFSRGSVFLIPYDLKLNNQKRGLYLQGAICGVQAPIAQIATPMASSCQVTSNTSETTEEHAVQVSWLSGYPAKCLKTKADWLMMGMSLLKYPRELLIRNGTVHQTYSQFKFSPTY